MLVGTVSGTFYCDHRNLQSLLNKSQREESVSEPLKEGDWEGRELVWGHVAKQLAVAGRPPASALPGEGIGFNPWEGNYIPCATTKDSKFLN